MADPRRRTFGPVVLVGLAAAGLAAVAGNRDWVAWEGANGTESSMLGMSGVGSAGTPLAGALALVLLACWGVVLVTRDWFRRAVAAFGLLVTVAMVVCAVLGYWSAADAIRAELTPLEILDPVLRPLSWFWIYLACAVLGVVAAAAAVRLVPAWPEMGSRYDAPGAERTDSGADNAAGARGLDLWRALDEGRDPTLTDRKPTDP